MHSVTKEILVYTAKVAIFFVLAIAAANLMLPDHKELAYKVKNAAKDEKTRVLLLSFVQNPAALQKASEIDEANNRLDSAIMEMELALGLLEMNNASTTLIEKYRTRLNQLANKKQKAEAEGTPRSKTEMTTPTGKSVKRWGE